MSMKVYGITYSPYRNGYTAAGDGPGEVEYMAYRRQRKLTFFAATVNGQPRDSYLVPWAVEWHLVSCVENKHLAKTDDQVILITAAEFERLQLLEETDMSLQFSNASACRPDACPQYWPDYHLYLNDLTERRLRIWQWYGNPLGIVPQPTERMKKRAADYAHRQIQKRDEYPDAHRDWEVNTQGMPVAVPEPDGYNEHFHNDCDDEFHRAARRHASAADMKRVEDALANNQEPPAMESFARPTKRRVQCVRADGTVQELEVDDYNGPFTDGDKENNLAGQSTPRRGSRCGSDCRE